MLTLTLFGAPCLTNARGQLLAIPRKALAMLALLAVSGRPMQRTTLADFLWPDRDMAHGLGMVRRVLLDVRKTLEDDQQVLVITDETLALDPHRFACDLAVLRAAKGISLTTNAGFHHAVAALETYQGAFLHGFAIEHAPEFDVWAQEQRVYWAEVFSALASRLVDAFLADGVTSQAIHVAEQWVERCPEQNAAYHALIRAALQAGEWPLAEETWKACQRWYAQLGLPAPAEVGALLRKNPKRQPHVPAPLQELQLPLTGRTPMMERLRQGWRQVRQGFPLACAIVGEEGIGKTRLVQEFTYWVRGQGAHVLWGVADDLHGRLPYFPLINALRHSLETIAASDSWLDDIWLSELSRLIPTVRLRDPHLPMTASDSLSEGRLWEAVAQLGMVLGANQPVMLILDNAQWADPQTRDLLLFLRHRWHGVVCRVMVLILIRSAALTLAPEVSSWLDRFLSIEPSCCLNLERLESEQVRELAMHLFVPAIAPQMGVWLNEATGGQPQYLTTTIRYLLQGNVLTWMGKQLTFTDPQAGIECLPADIPPSLRAMILAQIQRLPQRLQFMLQAAALLDDPIVPATIAALTETPVLDVLTGMEIARTHGLICEGYSGYAFAHQQIRTVLVQAMGSQRRLYLARLNDTTYHNAGSE